MNLSEKGFITPLTLSVSLLMFSFLFYQIQQYSLEKKFVLEQEEIVTLEALLQMGLVDLLDVIPTEEIQQETGTFYYDKGMVTYTISPRAENLALLSLEGTTKDKRKRKVIIHYDPTIRRVSKWIET